MKRPNASPPPKKGEWVCADTSWRDLYPVLTQGMCDGFWDDGKPRACWKLTISMADGVVHLSLIDPDASASVYTDAETVEEALGLLEEALASNQASWRKWKRK